MRRPASPCRDDDAHNSVTCAAEMHQNGGRIGENESDTYECEASNTSWKVWR